MSLLLDALNKADKERKRNQHTPSIDSRHEQMTPQNSSLRGVILGVVLLTISVASITSYILLTTHRSVENSNLNSASELSSTDAKTHAAPTQSVSAAEVTSKSAENATSIQSSNPKVETTQKIADLYHQNNQNQPGSQTQLNETQPNQNDSTKNSETKNLTGPSVVGNTSSINQFANIPELHDLPDTVLAKIPSMKYTEHHFNKLAQSEQGGNVMVNGNLKHVNDQLVPGVYLDKILEDGIVLHFENYAFKMHALNSWVNM